MNKTRDLLKSLTQRATGSVNQATSDTGAQMEARAKHYLLAQGLKWLESNYRCKGGEIDLIMQDAHALVFVEVRYRQNNRYGSAAETVDNRKQNKLRHAAEHYLQQQPHNGYSRFDVIAITGPEDQASIDWIQNAF